MKLRRIAGRGTQSRAAGLLHRRAGLFRLIGVLVALFMAVASIFTYFWNTSENPVTQQKQRVALTVEQEIALGLQAAPEMTAQHGGLSANQEAQALVDRIGQELVSRTVAGQSPYRFEFHVLDDRRTVNAFALPGGQIFITMGLLEQLETDGQLAGVLAHEIGHVIERHAAERLAKMQLAQGLSGAAVLATYDPDDPNTTGTAAVTALISNLVNLRYGRQDELESDRWAVRLLAGARYDPRSMLHVLDVLSRAGGGRPVEFFSTHPNPDRRLERLEAAIREEFPKGLPGDLRA